MTRFLRIALLVAAVGLFVTGLVVKAVMPLSMSFIALSVALFAIVLRRAQNDGDREDRQ